MTKVGIYPGDTGISNSGEPVSVVKFFPPNPGVCRAVVLVQKASGKRRAWSVSMWRKAVERCRAGAAVKKEGHTVNNDEHDVVEWLAGLRLRGMCCARPAQPTALVCTRPAGHGGPHGGRFETQPRSAEPFLWFDGERARRVQYADLNSELVRSLVTPAGELL